MDDLTRAGFLLHARTPAFAVKVERARDIIARSLDSNPYVAFSGGKDSLVALALACRAQPGITAIWSDDELEYPENETYIPAACLALGANLIVKTGESWHGGWFWPWVDAPYWRDQLPGTVQDGRPTAFYARDLGHRGVILGLRREESIKRRYYLSRSHEVFEDKTGMTRVHPLAGWTVDDVWAAILAWGLPPNPVYAILAATGENLREQRVGPLPLSNGGTLRAGWPEMFSRLLSRYGNHWG